MTRHSSSGSAYPSVPRQPVVSAVRSQTQMLARSQVRDTSDRCQLEGWGHHQGLLPLSTSDTPPVKGRTSVLASLMLFYVKSSDFFNL